MIILLIIVYLIGCVLSYGRTNAHSWNVIFIPAFFVAFVTLLSWMGFVLGVIVKLHDYESEYWFKWRND